MKFDLAAWGAELTPERPALWFKSRWYTYRDLNERATRVANRLGAAGIGFGARVGIVSPNHLAHFDLMFAAPKLGFVYVPFSPLLSAADLREQAHVAAPDLVFVDPHSEDAARQAFRCPRVSLDEYRAWLEHASRQTVQPPALSTESIQMILFCRRAGETRAVLIPYRQTLANAQGTAIGWQLGPEDCAIQADPCDQASLHVLATPLLTLGGRVALLSHFEPAEYLRLVQQLEATLMALDTSSYDALVAHPDFERAELGRIRRVIALGSSPSAALAAVMKARNLFLQPSYARSEVGVNVFGLEADDAAEAPGTLGRPLPHIDADISRADGTPCDDGETGELTLAGEALCSGYLDEGTAGREAFREGRFWTGDLMQRDAAGRYFLRGGRKDRYVSGGHEVYPSEVEAAMRRCTGVSECAVLSIPDLRMGETGLAVVSLNPGAPASAERLRAELRTHLSAHQLPSVILFMDDLPRDAAGQVDRAVLRHLLEAPSD